MNIQLYADEAKIEAESNTMNVFLSGVNLDDIVSQFTAQDVLDALSANDQLDAIVAYASENALQSKED